MGVTNNANGHEINPSKKIKRKDKRKSPQAQGDTCPHPHTPSESPEPSFPFIPPLSVPNFPFPNKVLTLFSTSGLENNQTTQGDGVAEDLDESDHGAESEDGSRDEELSK